MDDEVEPNPLDVLLTRSQAFENAILACLPPAGIVPAISDQKHELVAAACTLCIEHASALRAAFSIDAPNSGAALLRLQYEAVLRAAWMLCAANPSDIDKLARGLDLEAEQAAKKLPGNLEMLESVVSKAPSGLSAPLAEFNKYSRHALNSFVHSGIHPLSRAREGFPLDLAVVVVRFSNGLMHLAYRMLASLSGSQPQMDRVTRLFEAFSECLPMAKGWSPQA